MSFVNETGSLKAGCISGSLLKHPPPLLGNTVNVNPVKSGSNPIQSKSKSRSGFTAVHSFNTSSLSGDVSSVVPVSGIVIFVH